jgi:hypothetical protein
MDKPTAEAAEVGWFTPGHCQDIDGALWHAVGECEGARMNCNGRCCGPVVQPPEGTTP